MSPDRDPLLRRAQHLDLVRREAAVRALTHEQRHAFGVRFRVDGLVCSLAADRVDSLEHNLTTGLGVGTPLDLAAVDAALAFHHAGPRTFRLAIAESVAPGLLEAALRSRGLTWWRRRAVFVRDASPAPEVESTLQVREARPEEHASLALISAAVFGMAPSLATWGAAGARDPRWRRFAAFDGERAVATGRVFVDGDGAWLSGMATLPGDQRRGAQAALLAARINAARADGAEQIVLETLIDDADSPDGSGRNALRAGFRVLEVLRSWVPDSPAARARE